MKPNHLSTSNSKMDNARSTGRYVLTVITFSATVVMVLGYCVAANRRFLDDPMADSYMQTAEKVTSLSIYGQEALQRFRDEDAVTFDPSSGQRMGETLQCLKLSDTSNILMVGASQLAFVAGDSSPSYYTRRVDQVVERLANTPVEVYNLSAAGMNSTETALIMDKATKRVHFDHVIVLLLPHVLQYRNIRPALQNLPDPTTEAFVAHADASALDRWLDPSSINDRVGEIVLDELGKSLPFFRRRFPIQQWAAREVFRRGFPPIAASNRASAATPTVGIGPTEQRRLAINDGQGLFNRGLERSADGTLAAWVANVPRPPVSHVRDEELDKTVAVISGGRSGLILKQEVALGGDPPGTTVTLRANVKASGSRASTRLGLRVGDVSYFVTHPGDGAWHDLKVHYAFPYTSNDRAIGVTIAQLGGQGDDVRIANLALVSDERQSVYQYYFTDETATPILEHLESLLHYLDSYRVTTGAAITLVLSPHYQDPENPVYQPQWLEDDFCRLAATYSQKHGFHLLDARPLLPNSTFGTHSSVPLIDGVHFDAEGHRLLALAIVETLGL